MKSQFVSKFAKQRKRNQSEADITDPVTGEALGIPNPSLSPIVVRARSPRTEVVRVILREVAWFLIEVHFNAKNFHHNIS